MKPKATSNTVPELENIVGDDYAMGRKKFDLGSPGNQWGFQNLYINGDKLSERRMFAGLAMMGLMAHQNRGGINLMEGKYFAEGAVRVADALIKELNKDTDNEE